MIVRCEKCKTKFSVDENLIKKMVPRLDVLFVNMFLLFSSS